jgi:hypothetical protein
VESNKHLVQVFPEQSIIVQLAEEFCVVIQPYVSRLSHITAVLLCFPFYTIRKYVHKMKANKMDRYCGTQVRDERTLMEKLKQFEKLGLSGRMM